MTKPKQKPEPAPVVIRDRVRELRRVKASELVPHPANWRRHPAGQQSALMALLGEVGYAGALVAREQDDGTLMLIDGHLRAEATPDQEVPVLVVDVTEEEAKKLLASMDPLAAMADADEALHAGLVATIETDSVELEALWATVSGDEDALADPEDDNKGKMRAPPSPTVRYEITFDDEGQQERWYAFLRQLKDRVPGETIAERLDVFVTGYDWAKWAEVSQ